MSPPQSLDDWLPFRRPNSAARVRLICLPYAGGGASAFRAWADELPLTVEVCAVQPPGRESRFREPAFTRLQPLVAALADVVTPLFDIPVALYGHSMGALTAFELARELRRRGGRTPSRLIVTGRVAPNAKPRSRSLHALPEPEFLAELKRLNGTPAAVLENDELMRVLLPVLRADFTAHETHEFTEEQPFDCPILAVAGNSDTVAPPADMAEWRRHTRAAFEAHVQPGDHFFLQSHASLLLRRIARTLDCNGTG
jgi:medium-chain acyl-[acyl-carrier-protein] hydrolase